MSEVPFDPDEVSDEYEDKFVRGTMACQIWAYVLEKDPGEFADELQDGGRLEAEWTTAMEGEEHELGVAVADEYGLPVNYYGDRMVLGAEYQRRYRKAFKVLGIEPSMKEKLLNAAFFEVLSRD